MKNINIDHKILSKHFNHTIEGMRKLKRKYEATGESLWLTYVKAYNHDTQTLENKTDKELLTLQAELTGLLSERGVLMKNESHEDSSSFEPQIAEALDVSNGAIEPKRTISKKKLEENERLGKRIYHNIE